jgi:hypothetical protein
LAGGGLALLALGGATAQARAVHGVTSGNGSELETTVPITKEAGAAPRSVLTLGPRQLPKLHRGDLVKLSAEVQVTTTCVTQSARCVGRPYGFTPRATARIVVADRKRAAKGRRHVAAISRPQSVRCHQPRPNRNHHCVLVFRNVKARLGRHRRLPCALHRCHLNVILGASSHRSAPGNVLIVGADRPDGRIAQDMGRLNAVVIPRDAHPHVQRRRSGRRVSRLLPEGHPGSGGWRVVYSLKLKHLGAGDVIAAAARARTGIGALSYSAYLPSELIIAGNRRSTNPFPRNVSLNGLVTEANGFNCTQGPSAYRTPCVTRKAGLALIRRRPLDRHGRPRPLYLNLIQRSFPKLATARPRDAAQVLGGGFVAATIYRNP